MTSWRHGDGTAISFDIVYLNFIKWLIIRALYFFLSVYLCVFQHIVFELLLAAQEFGALFLNILQLCCSLLFHLAQSLLILFKHALLSTNFTSLGGWLEFRTCHLFVVFCATNWTMIVPFDLVRYFGNLRCRTSFCHR